MRSRITKGMCVLALCLPTLALTQQQRGKGTWELSAGGGIKLMDASLSDFLASGPVANRFTNSADPGRIMPNMGLRAGYNFTRTLAFSLGGEIANGSGVTYLTPLTALTYSPNLNARTIPFISIGSQITRVVGINDRRTHPTWGAHLGLGLRQMLGEHVALRVEGRMASEHFAELPGKKAAYPGAATIGLSYFVGGPRTRVETTVAGDVEPIIRVRVDTVRETITRTRWDTVRVTVPVSEVSVDQLVLRVQFRTDAAELLPISRPVLDTIAQAITETPGSRWEVQGHTDNVGGPAMNRTLAQDRAQTVVDYLVSRGVDRGILTAKGFGEDRPVFSNTTAYGRAQNRRVQLRRIPPPPVGQPVP